MVDCIIISANPKRANVEDAAKHITQHGLLYWSVGFNVKRDGLSFPLECYVHVSGRQVEYKARVEDVIPFRPEHYADISLKPAAWIKEWEQRSDAVVYPKSTLVITNIVRHVASAEDFRKLDGSSVQRPPQTYVRIMPPRDS